MNSIEITAKTVDEARKLAAEKLSVSVDSLQITVLEESKGLFGKSSVRVKADVPTVTPEPVTTSDAPAPTPAATKPSRGGRSSKAEPKVVVAEAAVPAIVEEAPEPKPAGRRAKKVEVSAETSDEPTLEPAADADEDAKPESNIQATQEDADQLLALVMELVAAADLQINVKLRDFGGRYVTVQLDGKDAAFLVGKHGEVLNAMQYLVNIIGGRRFNNGVRVTLDANDYRRRREETLTQLAQKIADQVQERGEEAVLDALPAFERRIVHKALSVHGGIKTYSEGEEPDRRVVIAPLD